MLQISSSALLWSHGFTQMLRFALFSLLLPPHHLVKAGQYKEFVFSLSPSLIIIDSNTISKFITAFCCTWMENSTYMGWQIKFAVEKLQHFCSAFGWKMLLVTPEVYGQKAKNASKTLQQNQTGLILLQCFCSIFLLEKLNLLQCLMRKPRAASYIHGQLSAALFCCVWMENAARGTWA